MKIRKGFVSNSSSSSFLCEICGAMESGMDATASELGFADLPCGHTICESEVIDLSDEEFDRLAIENVKKDIAKYERILNDKDESEKAKNSAEWRLGSAKRDLEELEALIENEESIRDNYEDITEYKYLVQQCPICTNKVILDKDLLRYMFKKFNSERQVIVEEIQNQFATRDEILEFLREVK